MIISVEELKEFITTDVSDKVLGARLSALETSIRKKTNNRFQDTRIRCCGNVSEGLLKPEKQFFIVGDTITVNDDLRVITGITDGVITTDEPLLDQKNVLITKVFYPKDVVMGVVNIMSWFINNPAEKSNISSETLSRHSVTYKDNSEFDEDIGCPSSLCSFLKQYMKARF